MINFTSKFRAMDAPNRKRTRDSKQSRKSKRPCHEVSSSSIQNPNSLPIAPSSNQSHIDLIISALLSSPNSSLSLPSPSCIDRVLEKALASVSSDVSVQNRLVNRTLELASFFHESAKRCYRKLASVHNSDFWPLPQDLTVKVFSMLDTKSLMQAMASCTMFNKYTTMDPICYSHIDLTTSAKNVDNGSVCTMIYRSGKELRFLELGHVEPVAKPATPLLTGACLVPLSYNKGFIGKCLKSLHLYDIRYMKDKSSIAGLVACSNITDLKIVGRYSPSEQLLKSLNTNCRFIEHLFLETYDFPSRSRQDSPAMVEFFTNIPNLTSLTLIGFSLKDATAQIIAEGARKLKYINLSRNPSIKGRFLRNSGDSFKDGILETLILRDCSSLEETEVSQFLDSLSIGNFRFIKHIDVSNNHGMLSEGGKRTYKPNFPLKKLKEYRPEVKFVADFNSSLLPRSEKPSSVIKFAEEDSDQDHD